MSIAILGRIKEVRSYLGATEDLVGTIKVECNVFKQEDELADLLKMSSASKSVYVVFMDEKEFRESSKKSA
jgi:thymidine kinase